jgi:uncharacterized membrane protein YbhN (UPF0104 family)
MAVYAAFALPWQEVFRVFATAHWGWVFAAVVASVAGWPLWIWQWQLLAPAGHRPSFGRMAEVTALSGSTNISVPMAGAVAAVAFLITRGRLPAAAAVSVYSVDQLVTGIAKVVVLTAAVWLVPTPDWLRTGTLTLAGATGLLVVVLLALAHGGALIRRLGARIGGRIGTLAGPVGEFVDHLEPMRSPLLGFAVTALAVAKDGAEIVAALMIQMAVGLEPSVPLAVLTIAMLGLATMAPISPGNLGIFEAAIAFSYQYMGAPLGVAAAAAVLQHAVVFVASFAGLGYLAIALPREASPPGKS